MNSILDNPYSAKRIVQYCKLLVIPLVSITLHDSSLSYRTHIPK